MLKLLRRKNPCTLLGIDITSTAVNIIELSHQQAQYCVEGYGRALLPDHAVEAGCIRDLDAVVQAIQRALIEVKSPSKQVVLAVPNAFTISKIIQMSASLNDRDMDAWVRLDVEKHTSYSLKDIYLDFEVVSPCAQNPALLDVLIVASRAEHVNQRVEAVRRAGLMAHIVETESFAFERAALAAANIASSKVIFMIDIGIQVTNYMVFDGVKIIFSREDTLNGSQLIQAVTDVQDVFFMQVKRAWQFFTSTTPNSILDHIILSGPVSHLPGLARLVQSRLNKPCFIANPLSQMVFSNRVNREQIEQDASHLMVACGLALRGA